MTQRPQTASQTNAWVGVEHVRRAFERLLVHLQRVCVSAHCVGCPGFSKESHNVLAIGMAQCLIKRFCSIGELFTAVAAGSSYRLSSQERGLEETQNTAGEG